jgi:hypothetical protein
MKKAISFISGEILERMGDYAEDVLEAIKTAQEDAIKEAVQYCADNADADCTIINDQHNISKEDIEVYVIKSSILDCADKLIKEL